MGSIVKESLESLKKRELTQHEIQEEKLFQRALEDPDQAKFYQVLKDEFEFNIVLLGQTKVGKTSFIRSLKDESVIRSTNASFMHAHYEKEITKHKLAIDDQNSISLAFVSTRFAPNRDDLVRH